MKILYIHQYFKTPEEGGAIRSYYLATGLAKNGHDVHLITASNKFEGRKVIEGVNVYYLPIKYDNSFGFTRRVWAFVRFMVSAYLEAKRIEGIQVCYATSTPLSIGIIALLLKKLKNIPYFFEVRDLWPKVPEEMGYIKSPLLKTLLRNVERIIYKNADKIISLSPGISEYIKSITGLDTTLIPNISDCNFFYSNSIKNNSSRVNIAYIGAIGKANDLMALIAIAKHCAIAGIVDVHFFIAGDGADKAILLSKIEKDKLDNVTYLATLDKLEVKNLLKQCAAVYVSFADFQILSTCSPNKFFDGLAAGKIIITNYHGWITELVMANKCGVYLDRNNPQNFINEAVPLLRDVEIRTRMQKNAYLLAKANFDRPLLVGKFLALFNN